MLTLTLAVLLSVNLFFYLEDFALEIALRWSGRVRAPAPSPAAPNLRLAVLIPFWKSDTSILQSEYDDFTVFLGVHSGQPDAWKAAHALEREHERVIVLVHREGDSRAEAWRSLAEKVLASEKATGITYGGFVLLEGSDAVHSHALKIFSHGLAAADLVQIPVLPTLPAWRDWGAGAFVDEATDLQREFRLRAQLGLFVPSQGTGTALTPLILRRLLQAKPRAFSHSYALGAEATRLGFRTHLALAERAGSLVSVRQACPENFRWALKRRARLARESAIDGRRAYGWGRSLSEAYFFWRDTRILAFTLFGFVTSVLFLALSLTGQTAEPNLPLWIGYFWLINFALSLVRLALRMRTSRESHGWKHALLLPLRWPAGNMLLSLAHWRAVAGFRRNSNSI